MSTPEPSEVSALRQAGELLTFISESPKDVPPTISTAITEAWEAEQTNQWNSKIASSFWVAYSSLCTLAKPASVDSISANSKPTERPWWMFWRRLTPPKSLSRRTADRYLWLMMTLLILTVALSFIASTIAKLDSENAKLFESASKVFEKADADVDRLELAVGDKEFSDKTLREEDRRLIKQTQAECQEYNISILQIVQNTARISRVLRIFGMQLFNYYKGTLVFTSVSDIKTSLSQFPRLRQDTTENQKDAAFIISVINSAILPIILGMTGACAYVVRTISEETKGTTFTGTSPIQHLVRVALGALAGVVIGFGGVITDTGLSSAALSFIAGYAVEPVFATLDGIAEKFKRAA